MTLYTEHSTIVHAFGVKGSNLLPIASRFCLRQNRYAIWIKFVKRPNSGPIKRTIMPTALTGKINNFIPQ